MGRGFVASGNLCQVGWEDTADDIEIQRHYDAGPVCPAVNSKGLAAFLSGGDENKEEHHHDGPPCLLNLNQ